MIRIAINGFGRIGRMVLKAGIDDPAIEFVAVNDLTDAKTLAHLLKHDSVHGRFNGMIESDGKNITVNGKEIIVLAEKEPRKLPWKKLKIDCVIESTGRFTNKEDCSQHIRAGAKKVLLSAPPKDKGIPIIVKGANEDKIKGDIISNASCTTNSLAPVVKVLDEKFGIENGFLTTVHSYTADQNLVDGPHKDLRRARSAAINIIPTTTGAAESTAEVIPNLKGKMTGIAVRVPTANGSLSNFICTVKKKTTAEEVNKAMKDAAENDPMLSSVLEYSEEPLVSTDIIGNPASSIFDSSLTRVINGKLVSVCAWYDNEWGYSKRMIDLVKMMF